jgi:hypothetical protein
LSTQGWRRIAAFTRIIVTLGAAYLVYIGVDWSRLADLLWRADFFHIVLAAVILSLQFGIMVWRWQIIVEMLGEATVGAPLLAIALGRSLLIGQPLPSTVGGDVVRVLMLSAQTGAGLATRSVICDRLVGLGVLIALVIVILPFFGLLVDSGIEFVALAAISLVGIGALYLVFAYANRLARFAFASNYLASVLDDCKRMVRHERASWLVLFLSLAAHLLGVGLIYELAHALSSSISLLQCLMILPPALLISAIPISLSGWGLREGALAAGFALVGASSEIGVAASILFGLTGPLIGIITEMMSPLLRSRDVPSKDA